MTEIRSVPSVEAGLWEQENAEAVITEALSELLYGDSPALHLKANERALPKNNDQDIPVIKAALRNLGYKPLRKDVRPDETERTQGIESIESGPDEWHMDGTLPFQYPANNFFTLFRHQNITGSARVQTRFASHKYPSTSGLMFSASKRGVFEPDQSNPVYEIEQGPGDRILFISLGGIMLDNTLILPTEHRFTTIGDEERKIAITGFDCYPNNG